MKRMLEVFAAALLTCCLTSFTHAQSITSNQVTVVFTFSKAESLTIIPNTQTVPLSLLGPDRWNNNSYVTISWDLDPGMGTRTIQLDGWLQELVRTEMGYEMDSSQVLLSLAGGDMVSPCNRQGNDALQTSPYYCGRVVFPDVAPVGTQQEGMSFDIVPGSTPTPSGNYSGTLVLQAMAL